MRLENQGGAGGKHIGDGIGKRLPMPEALRQSVLLGMGKAVLQIHSADQVPVVLHRFVFPQNFQLVV